MAGHSQSHGSSHPHGAGDYPLVGHLVPIGTLVLTGIILLVLTVVTVFMHYVDIGEMNIVLALFIASVKATLVGLYFMHLRWDRPFNQLIFVASVVFVVLLMAFCTLDSKQYQKTLTQGNPKMAQQTLDTLAKDAPITAKKAP